VEVKTTDIPNGYVVYGPKGKNILVDIDENGKAEHQAMEIELKGWPQFLEENGHLRGDVLVLVHTVKGDGQMLVKRLSVRQLVVDEKAITAREIGRIGKLGATAEMCWKAYMEEVKTKEVPNGQKRKQL
jgi:hypothetical protein